jgi:hypothetical protein
MVAWFDPVQLAATGLQAAVSGIFGAYSDKREIQAALAPDAKVIRDYAALDELWIDYVADLGDGFAPTYTVAHMLAQPRLTIHGDGETWETERGRILLLGGDQVYPTANRTEYENRMMGPYRAALPGVVPEEAAPHLYAIPGNHDWYDGLTSFIRMFCQEHWIGGWRTRQTRSYFALELPRRWWLWAIDIQFDVYIDDTQLSYFRNARTLLQPGDRVVLMTGKPSWTKGMRDDPSYKNLAYFEDEMLKGTGATLAVVVSGDLHHYARYADDAGKRHRLTSGGGGAYLYPTHHLPDPLRLDEHTGEMVYGLRAAYPARAAAARMRWGALWRLASRNRRFLLVIFGLYLLLSLLLQVPARQAIVRQDLGLGDFGGVWWWDVVVSRSAVFAALVIVPLLVLFAAGRGLWQKLPPGLLHAAGHLGLVTAAVAATACVLDGTWPARFGVVIAAIAAAVATLPGTALFGLYLALGDLVYGRAGDRFEEARGRFGNEAFSCQGIEDYKNFLRFHIGPHGLTIYPIGLDRVARRSELRLKTGGQPGEPFFVLPDAVVPRLIEPQPIRVPGAGG